MRCPVLLPLLLSLSLCPFAHAFEACSEQNSYLEDLLPLPEAVDINVSLPMNCVEASQRSLAANGYYGFCPTLDGQPMRDHVRPCLSEKYVSAVYSTLINVADCLDFDPRLAFATFNLESAMHLNAVGAATDVGIGQLTKTAIDEITLNALPQAKRKATASPKPACAKILPYMTPMDSDKAHRCGFMATPDNPTRNLVYSILLIQQNRKAVDRYWDRLAITLPPSIDSERLKERLTMLAYNSGSSGPLSTLKAYAEQMGPRLNERLLNFENHDFYAFTSYIRRFFPVAPGQESSRKRVAKYVQYIINAARRVEGLAHVRCFDLQTFPPLDPPGPEPVMQGPSSLHGEAQKLVAAAVHELSAAPEADQRSCAARRAEYLFALVGKNGDVSNLNLEQSQVYQSLCP